VSLDAVLGLADARTDPLTASIVRAIAESALELGLVAKSVRSQADESSVGTLLSVGLPQYYDRLLAGRRSSRRITWFGEPLSRLRTDTGNGRTAGRRLIAPALRVLHEPAKRMKRLPLPRRLDDLRAAAYIDHERRVNLDALIGQARAVDLVVVTSRDRAAVLAGFGVVARVVPFGYHAALAGPIVTDPNGRDIPAVAIGSGLNWSSRRARGVRACAAQLGASRLVVSRPTWGADRDALLRRSRILLDVHRIPGNFIGLRILLAAAAGAVLVTEPLDDPWPFEPGRHYVEAALADLTPAIEALLADEPRRRRIVDAAQALITGPLSMASSLRAVLA
jgi:hypothetical protein